MYTSELYFAAGRTTTNEELEDMLEQGNPAVFTQVHNSKTYNCMYMLDFSLFRASLWTQQLQSKH